VELEFKFDAIEAIVDAATATSSTVHAGKPLFSKSFVYVVRRVDVHPKGLTIFFRNESSKFVSFYFPTEARLIGLEQGIKVTAPVETSYKLQMTLPPGLMPKPASPSPQSPQGIESKTPPKSPG
jgi:hypothetical protein